MTALEIENTHTMPRALLAILAVLAGLALSATVAAATVVLLQHTGVLADGGGTDQWAWDLLERWHDLVGR